MNLRPSRLALACLWLAGAFAGTAAADNQVSVPGKGRGELTLAVQNLFIDDHTNWLGQHGHPGTITTNTVYLHLDYGLTDKWAVSVGLPWRSSKFAGVAPHNPGTLDDDHGQYFMDDGNFHGGWQDWSLGVRYAWRTEPFLITPFLEFGTPARDYTTFAHAAVGTGQWRVEAGVNVGKQFSGRLRNLYFVGGVAYAWMQPVDRRVNHATFTAELGWFITPTLSARLNIAKQKTYNGFDFPIDFPNQHDDHFFYHDQNLRNDYVNAGIGFDWQATEKDRFFFNQGRTLHGENTHLVKYSVTLGYSRAF